MKLLVLAINGKGLGHLNRTLLLARSLVTKESRAEVRFLVESFAFPLVAQAGFEVLKLPDPMHDLGRFVLSGRRSQLEETLVATAVESMRPQAVLVDFLLNRQLFSRLRELGCRVWVVLRRLRRTAMQQLAREPAVNLVDAWLLPHESEEFDPGEIPANVSTRCHFVGRLMRHLDVSKVPEVRSRYADSKEASLLGVVSLGGGGWPDAVRLVKKARQAISNLRMHRPGLQAIVVYGPLYADRLPVDEPGFRSVRFEPDLPELMAAADVVVSSAGYNSVLELLASGTPGVLVPLESPGQDDQHRRAERVRLNGRGLVAEPNVQDIQQKIEIVLAGKGPLPSPPKAAGDNHRAGRILADLLRS